MFGRLTLNIFEDVFISKVLNEIFTIVELFILWVDVDDDTVVSIDLLVNKLVVK